MADLIDLNYANLEEKELAALRYIEHLALNNGKLTDPQLLNNTKEFYTEKEIKFINHEWAWVNGLNWTFNKLYTLLQMMRIISKSTLHKQGAGLSCSCVLPVKEKE